MENVSILNKRSCVVTDGSPKLPTYDQLGYGEIAINYADGYETLSIRNSSDEVQSLSLGVSDDLSDHIADTDNPHSVTKAQVGLGNVDNTADMDKPVSTSQQAALDAKLDNAENGGVANDLETNSSTVALSAAQGIILYEMLDDLTGGASADLSELIARVAAVEEEIDKANTFSTGDLLTLAKEIHEELTI